MKLQILLATYNGEAYLREQLESILEQTLFQNSLWQIGITVRDDGSTDGTCRILKEYSEKYPEFSYYTDKNKGVIASFLELIQNVPEDVDAVALADQDDIWMKDKLECAVSVVEQHADSKKPFLYCGRPMLADEFMNPISSKLLVEDIRPAFGNALVENICIGCTAVFNRSLVSLVKLGVPDFTVMHDWWLYLLTASFGEIYYDPVPHMYYRQHSGNAVGVQRNYWNEFIARVKRFRKNRFNISRQIESLWHLCKENELSLTAEKLSVMEDVLRSRRHPGARFRLLGNNEIYRQRKMDNLIFKLIFLTGTI